MACCAIADCGDPTCPVCTVNERFHVEPCPQLVDGVPCKMVAGHPPGCRAVAAAEKVDTSTRDGDPKLAGERERGNLAFRPRHRDGPLRSNV